MYKNELECSNCDRLTIIITEDESPIFVCPLCAEPVPQEEIEGEE